MDWMNEGEAKRFFGVGITELERIVVEHDIDVDVDEEGKILRINPADCKEALFKEHEKKVGHRPDNPEKMKEAAAKQERQEKAAKVVRDMKREKLIARVGGNGGP